MRQEALYRHSIDYDSSVMHFVAAAPVIDTGLKR